VLEAEIALGESLIISMAGEFIENNGEDAGQQKAMSEEEKKQDCEIKAFKRLAAKIKRVFPRLPILLLADSLYASEPVMDICRANKWDFIIWYKTGSIPSITQEYEGIPEKGKTRSASLRQIIIQIENAADQIVIFGNPCTMQIIIICQCKETKRCRHNKD